MSGVTPRDEKVPSLEQYLQAWGLLMADSEPRPGWAFKCQDMAIHHHGSLAPPGPYTEDERHCILEALEALREPPEIKMCFRNATMLAHAATLAGVDLEYAEGKAAVMIPIDHAWCALPSGRPVDVTLRTNAEYDAGDDEEVDPEKLLARAERNLVEQAYWGYVVPSNVRWNHLERVGRWAPVIDDPEGDFPLMRSLVLPWAG